MKVKDLWRFAEKFESGKDDEDCWEWLGRKNWKGYGQLRLNGGQPLAHRVAYEYCVGPIPEGLQIDHLCRNRGCVNPNHLEVVTGKENVNRGIGNRRKEKTHCPRGHEYTGDNLRVSADNRRHCRQCHREHTREFRRRNPRGKDNIGEGYGSHNRLKTHCRRGHPYSGDNLYIGPSGGRHCKECRRSNHMKHYHSRKGEGGS